jgi:hypothetical protein
MVQNIRILLLITPPVLAMSVLQEIRKSKFRLVWDWGRWLYRWSAIGYSAVSLYDNPWLVRAVVSAIWAASKFAFGHLW